MKITNCFWCLFLLCFWAYINVNGQNQNGLNFLQIGEESKLFYSVSSPTQYADSSIIYNDVARRSEGYLYQWNENGKLTNVQFDFLNTRTLEWWENPQYEHVYDFDKSGNLILEERYNYNKSKEPHTKNEFVYNEDGNCIEAIDLNSKKIYTYNQAKQLEREEWFFLNEDQLTPYVITNYAYDKSGNLQIFEKTLNYNGDDVADSYVKYTYTYNDKNNVTELEAIRSGYMIMPENASLFIGKTKIKYINTYSDNDLLISSEASFYNETGDELMKTLTDYAYNKAGNKTSIINSRFDYDKNEWIPKDKTIKDYDGAGNVTLLESTVWVEDTQKWEGTITPQNWGSSSLGEKRFERKEWTFDENNNMTSALYYLWEDTQFIVYKHIEYFYPKNNVGVEQGAYASGVSVYLKGNSLIIESPDEEYVSLFSVTGQNIFTVKKDVGEILIPVEPYSKGIYVLKGSSGWTRKINI